MRPLAARALALLSALTLTGCLIEPDAARCDGATTCSACTDTSGCGWCPGVGCVEGTSLGPKDDTLSCGDGFLWSSCGGVPVVDPCESISICGACLAEGCAWCPRVEGGACIGRGAECESGAWIETCLNRPMTCDRYSACADCLSDVSCEWRRESRDEVFAFCDVSLCDSAVAFDIGCGRGNACR